MLRRRIAATVFGSVALLTSVAHATPSMTLEEALAYAHANHPRLRASRSRIDVAEAQAKEPGAQWEPRFGATVQVAASSANNTTSSWLNPRGAMELPRISGSPYIFQRQDLAFNPYASTTVAVGGEQRLFDFGRIAAETAAADARVAVEQARLQDQTLAVELGIQESYYALLAARAVSAVARDAVARSRVHRNDAAARVAQGVRSRIEQERAEADLARFEVNQIRAEAALRTAQTGFALATSAPTPFLDASGDAPTDAPTVPALEIVLDAAGKNDPAIRAAVLAAKAAHARVTAANAQNRPEILAIGTVEGAAGGAPRVRAGAQIWGAGALPWVPNYYGGIMLSWRFSDPTASARTETAKREEAAARADIGVVQNTRILAIEQAWVGLDASVRALPILARAVTAARANYDQADVRFQNGLGTAVELADAEALRVNAEIEAQAGRFETQRARARLVNAAGGTL